MTEITNLVKLSGKNFVPSGSGVQPVYAEKHNELIDKVGEIIDKLNELSDTEDTLKDDLLISQHKVHANVVRKFAKVSLTGTEIVGNDAGDLAHTAGAILVAAPGAGKVLVFRRAVLVFTYDTAAYGGGNDDLVVRQDTTTVSAAIADADLLGASADKVVQVEALSAADLPLTANKTINLSSTAFSDPGTAAGTLTAYVEYDEITL